LNDFFPQSSPSTFWLLFFFTHGFRIFAEFDTSTLRNSSKRGFSPRSMVIAVSRKCSVHELAGHWFTFFGGSASRLDLFQSLAASGKFGDDRVNGGGPDEELGILVPGSQEIFNGVTRSSTLRTCFRERIAGVNESRRMRLLVSSADCCWFGLLVAIRACGVRTRVGL
jgi:hypothetical protein